MKTNQLFTFVAASFGWLAGSESAPDVAGGDGHSSYSFTRARNSSTALVLSLALGAPRPNTERRVASRRIIRRRPLLSWTYTRAVLASPPVAE